MVRAYKSGVSSDPEAIADISRRREAGESLASIGKDYNLTRERIRQLCNRWGVVSPVPVANEQLEKALELLKTGQAFSAAEAAQKVGFGIERLRRAAKKAGVDLAAAATAARTKKSRHIHDGKTFGMWAVIAGSARAEKRPQVKAPVRVVDCRCECGTERTVQYSNLLGGLSRGCGCRNSKASGGRLVTPWQCRQTGERQSSTTDLAKRLQVNVLGIFRRLNRGKTFIAANGQEWIPLQVEAIPWSDHKNTPWVCLDTGETWATASALTQYLGISGSQLSLSVRASRTYCGADRRHYVPVGKENLSRSEFHPRPGQTKEVSK